LQLVAESAERSERNVGNRRDGTERTEALRLRGVGGKPQACNECEFNFFSCLVFSLSGCGALTQVFSDIYFPGKVCAVGQRALS
jgi:hypothetical protein